MTILSDKTTISSDSRAANVTQISWPDPQPLNDLVAVPAFTDNLLPKVLHAFVRDVADRMQSPPELVAAPVLIALASTAGRRFRIQPKQYDTAWIEVPNLFGAVVAPPGYQKSPSASAVFSLLQPIEEQWRAEYEREIAKWCARNKKKKGDKKSKDDDDHDEGTGEPKPKEKRLVLNNCTWEAAHEILCSNPQGCLLERDELAGLLAETEKPGHQGEREFLLTAWNGNSPYRVDRILRGSTHAEGVCISLFGGIQPARIRSHLAGEHGVALSDDGFAQRLQILFWPDARPYTYTDRAPNKEATATVAKIFRILANLPADPPSIFTFEEKAQAYFERWYVGLQTKVRSKKIPALICSHLTKYAGLMPTLAVLFELSERAAAVPTKRSLTTKPAAILLDPTNKGLLVSHLNVMRADRLCEFLEAHARRFYGCSTREQYTAKILAKKLQQNPDLETFTARDIERKCWKGLHSLFIKTACDVLVEKHWIATEKRPTTAKGGRSTTEYRVNPKIREMKHREGEDE
jgi:hypothetical protein